jgi:pantetheine-phosphate adenylyltransferase
MAQPRIAIFPGSFDPPTLGHLDVIRRAAALFDTLIVAILENTSKQPYFSVADRSAMLGKALGGVPNARVEAFGGLLADYARSREAGTIVRGIRGGGDLEYERQMAETNRHLNPDLDTVFFTPSPAVAHISSTLVREIAALGGSVRGLVPDAVLAAIDARDPLARAGSPGRMQRT